MHSQRPKQHPLTRRRLISGAAGVFGLGGATLILGGCGYRLRGQVQLSKDLTPVAISGNDQGLVDAIRDAFEFGGTPVVTSSDTAQAVVRLIGARVRRQVRTTDSRGLATSYRLVYRVRYEVVNRKGDVLIKEARVNQQRDLDFDANQILTKENEQRFLIEDMRRDIAQSILRRLSVLS